MATSLLVNKKVVFLAQSSLVVLLMLYFILPIRNVVFPSWFNGAWQEISTSEVLRMRNAAKSRRLAVLEEVCPTKRSPGITLNDVDKKKIHDYSYLNTPQFRKKVAENGHAMFMSVMSLERKHNYLHLYKVFAARLYSKNISFFVNSGTVLGAYRHGGFIPWDDDLDVGVDIAELGTLHSLLTCMEGFQFTQYRRSHWKFRHAYREDERPLDLDVFFYETNDKYIWSNTQILVDNFIFRRRDAFPLGQALFEGIRMPMPGELTKSVTREFNVNICCCKENKRHQNNTWWALQYSADAFSKTSVECKEIAYMYDMNLDTGA